MNMSQEITGVLLAGGKSRRMGRDKRNLVLGGETLLNRALNVLVEIFPEVLVVFGEESFAIPNDRVRVVHDLIPNRAAAGGLYTGLSYSTHSKSFVVACDMPFLNSSAIKYLITLSEGFDITSVKLSHGLQTMHGIYSKSCVPFLQKMVKDESLRLQELFSESSLRLRQVPESEMFPFDPQLLSFMNLNSPADLEFARKVIESSG